MIARITGMVAICALAAGCAAAVAEWGFDSTDTDENDAISRAEWADFMDGLDLYPRYDDNDDGYLSREEYREAVDSSIEGESYYLGFDRDRNDLLTENEFRDGIFNSFDRDGNGWFNEGEYESAVNALAVEL